MIVYNYCSVRPVISRLHVYTVRTLGVSPGAKLVDMTVRADTWLTALKKMADSSQADAVHHERCGLARK
jgi:hypothetical protein